MFNQRWGDPHATEEPGPHEWPSKPISPSKPEAPNTPDSPDKPERPEPEIPKEPELPDPPENPEGPAPHSTLSTRRRPRDKPARWLLFPPTSTMREREAARDRGSEV